MSANNNTSNKKLKTNMNEKGKDEFQIARDYLLSCPLLPSDSPAIKAALEGIAKEEKRRIRDAKLRNKFGGTEKSTTNSTSASLTLNDEIVVVEKESDSVILEGSNTSNNMVDDDMEWQDVRQQQSDEMVASARAIEDSFTGDDNEEEEDCFLGRTLAKATIDAIAEQAQNHKPVTVQTPLAAVAVALHVSLRTLGFACTGIPETKPCKGFAPPIRELPKSEFLPKGWTNQPLRYRKPDTGALILTVSEFNNDPSNCKVTFCPQNNKETNPCLEFALNEHMNLDSWNAAKLKSDAIGPSLHYKNLSGLLSKFCRTFDLGSISEDTTMGGMQDYYNNIGKNSKMEASGVFEGSNSISFSESKLESKPSGYSVPTRLDQAFPSVPAAAAAARGRLVDPMTGLPHGDFSGDLLPAGLQDPRFAGRMPGMPGSGGNLMGPNHPAFAGQFPGNPMGIGPMGGPGTMQPRFDPIVPPCLGGGGEDIPGTARRQRRGEPNPDHLRPPNSLGNNMFM